MNANVTIDYATAEKVMDFDGRGGGVLQGHCWTPDARAGPRSTSKSWATRQQ
jgi:hypothetical protein